MAHFIVLVLTTFHSGVELLKLENMSMALVGKLSDQRKKGLIRRIQRRLEHARLQDERKVRKQARHDERRKQKEQKKASRKSG